MARPGKSDAGKLLERLARMSREASGPFDRLRYLVLGPQVFQYVKGLWSYEPLIVHPPKSASLLEDLLSRPSDIYAHLPTLYLLTVDRGARRVLELGTRDGVSTVVLLSAVRETGGHVTSIDIEPCPEAQARVREAGIPDRWTFVQSDDLVLPWRDPVDHLFIDTSHRYDHTLRELQKYEPFVVPGGVITLHDTSSHPEVWDAVATHFARRKDVRVFRYLHNNGLAVITKSA